VRIDVNSRLAIAFLALSAAGASHGAPVESDIQIELRSYVQVRAHEVHLGDVAVIHSRDAKAIELLVTLPLGAAPRGEAESTVTRESIERWVHHKLGLRTDLMAWSGSDEVVVSTATQTVSAQRLEGVALKALNAWLSGNAARYSVDLQPLPDDLRVPAGEVTVAARELPLDTQPAPRMTIWLDIAVDGEHIRAMPVSAQVHAWSRAWVAPAPLPAGAVVSASSLQEREVAFASKTPVLPSPLRVTRAVRAGEPLTPHNSSRAPLISRGEWVSLHLKDGGIELDRQMQAMQDGELGEVVRVRAADGGEAVSARVTASGRVEAAL
jgi:flagella basal body P-ring formation protein FlgA